MKRISLLLMFSILSIVACLGQVFPETGAGTTCSNCVPSNKYTVVSGTPDVSDINNYGGTSIKWKNSSLNDVVLPDPPSTQYSDAVNYLTKNFLTLISGPNIDSKVQFKVTQFIPGQKYKMHFAVMASRLLSSTFGSEAVLEIRASNSAVNLLTSTIDLTSAKNTWMETYVEFTPTTEETIFTLSGNTTVGTGFVNFDIRRLPLDCILPAGKQVDLYKSNVQFMYPCQTQNLDLLVKLPWPTGADVVWKHTPNSSGASLVANTAQHAVPNVNPYYAFYYNEANDCYSLNPQIGSDKSTAEVNISYVPQQVPLKLGSVVAVKCPNTQYALKAKLATQSDSSRVRWFSNSSHQGSPIPNGVAKMPGKYYAFFYSDEFGCYSTDVSNSSVTVAFETPCCKAGTNQVTVQPNTITNTCPKLTADLTKTTLNFNVPLNTQLVWFNNSTHTAPAISDPSAVGPGTYYAFVYDAGAGCYNTDNSTAQVKVSTSLCATSVQLNLRVALQGAIQTSPSDHLMRNDLQVYGNSGLLPTSSPYGGFETCLDINNPAEIGNVVDWVKVEVRSAANPSLILESRNLILSSDGFITNLDGTTGPSFASQTRPVRIVVKHRNHLAIMSNPIQNFSAGSTLSYDFTTALSQASNAFGDPPQMVQKNGIWCMWAGDLNDIQDLGIDGTDFNDVYEVNKVAPVDTYSIADLNMDGGVDANDYNLVYFNNVIAPYSSLINY